VSPVAFRERLIEYQRSNSGKLMLAFNIVLGSQIYQYDIFWGDPSIIFDQETRFNSSPLAVTLIPHRHGLPATRVFLHEGLNPNNVNVFEMVVAHEIGHLWLHDIVGFNNPSTRQSMSERDTESWCDYFAYCFFQKYRGISNAESFSEIIRSTGELQMELYSIDKTPENIEHFSTRANDFLQFSFKVGVLQIDGDRFVAQMLSTIETTLVALSDIFRQNENQLGII